jgi:hypothetical protein
VVDAALVMVGACWTVSVNVCVTDPLLFVAVNCTA